MAGHHGQRALNRHEKSGSRLTRDPLFSHYDLKNELPGADFGGS